MATPDTGLIPSRYSQDRVVKYVQDMFAFMGQNLNFRTRLLDQDRLYQREGDLTPEQQKAYWANKMGNFNKFQNVSMPIVQPQVESTVAYFTDLFLSSYPLFPVVTDPSAVDLGLQLETILGKSALEFQWARHLAMCFRDGLKYNLMGAEVDWDECKIPSVISDPNQSLTYGTPQEVLYSGNRIKHLDLYNTFFDMRIAPSEVHSRGEFAGYSELITRMELKQWFADHVQDGITDNAAAAFSSGTSMLTTTCMSPGMNYYVPQVNPAVFLTPNYTPMNWLSWAGMDTQRKIHYSDMYEKTVLYCRVIPKEFAFPRRGANKNQGDVQIYKFVVINRKVVIMVKRMTNAHAMLPIIIGQMTEDGLGLQTKSVAENVAPYQALSTSLWNSAIQSQRRKVYDRIFYDPSLINKSDIDKADAIARIPVKQAAYGKPITEAFSVVPYRDEGVANILQMAAQVGDMADVATGSNRVQRGQFQKGNKTRFEVEETMTNSDARPRMAAILLGVGWLQPIKTVIKCNVLQYQPPANLFNMTQQKNVAIKPQDIRTLAWEFQLADGVLPSSKLLDFNLFGQILQYAAANPAVGAEYDLTGMFFYQMKSQGARWVDAFKRDQAGQQNYINQQRLAATPIPEPTPGQPAAQPPAKDITATGY